RGEDDPRRLGRIYRNSRKRKIGETPAAGILLPGIPQIRGYEQPEAEVRIDGVVRLAGTDVEGRRTGRRVQRDRADCEGRLRIENRREARSAVAAHPHPTARGSDE